MCCALSSVQVAAEDNNDQLVNTQSRRLSSWKPPSYSPPGGYHGGPGPYYGGGYYPYYPGGFFYGGKKFKGKKGFFYGRFPYGR
jgi:hypothetical protein